jgi:hypothetical protein
MSASLSRKFSARTTADRRLGPAHRVETDRWKELTTVKPTRTIAPMDGTSALSAVLRHKTEHFPVPPIQRYETTHKVGDNVGHESLSRRVADHPGTLDASLELPRCRLQCGSSDDPFPDCN